MSTKKDNFFWLPPNKQLKEREGVHLTHEPRKIRYFKRFGKNDIGWWNIEIVAFPLDIIRAKFQWNFKDTPEATENLQTWINNMGPALYNPTHWYLSSQSRKIDGTHRMKVLEAMNFDRVYVLLATGVPQLPREDWREFGVNNDIPVKSASLKDTICPECGGKVKWSKEKTTREGRCRVCKYEVYENHVYPEPVSIQIPHVS